MRTAIVSDIHGNLEAFQEVLKDIEGRQVDQIISLGDNIGYGPDPEEVLQHVHSRNIRSVMGNHELGIVDPSSLRWFNPSARKSLLITRDLLSPWGVAFINTMKPACELANGLCVHGFPPDSITTYLFQVPDEKLLGYFLATSSHVCFVGHTHELGLVTCDSGKVDSRSIKEGVIELQEACKYIVNAGSVGQPRDGDNRAKYIIWDDSARSLTVICVPYDIAMTARKILNLGFPRVNADRLW
ncbi:MAG: metallophosphoesterase [Syntrophobacteraceae bacterium]|nr:metallophosphoesterase [Syntrophobacteraceae bacterium]